jgi:hypothetical protein
MVIWILSLMQLLLPYARYAEKFQFEATAVAIDKVAHEEPLYDDDDGVVRTVVELVSLAYHESRFDPRAVDHGGTSLGLAQVDTSNLRALGLTRPEQLFDPETNLRAALKLIRISHHLCRRHPHEERLAHEARRGSAAQAPPSMGGGP